MSIKFHLSKDGLPSVCQAQVGKCPLGGPGDHYDDKFEAFAAAEEKLNEEFDLLHAHQRKILFHVNERGAVEVCRRNSSSMCDVKALGRFSNTHSEDSNIVVGAAQAYRDAFVSMSKNTVIETTPLPPTIPTQDPITNQARAVRGGLTPLLSTGMNQDSTPPSIGDVIEAVNVNGTYVGAKVTYTRGTDPATIIFDLLDSGVDPKNIKVYSSSGVARPLNMDTFVTSGPTKLPSPYNRRINSITGFLEEGITETDCRQNWVIWKKVDRTNEPNAVTYTATSNKPPKQTSRPKSINSSDGCGWGGWMTKYPMGRSRC